jgi:arsenate reductase
MLAQPSMIKRPIIETGSRRIVGFSPQTYAEAFGCNQ